MTIRLRTRNLARCLAWTGVWIAASPLAFADWPQPGGGPQHTHFTPDSPAPAYRAAWAADFSPELIYSAQPIIAQGRVFQTTLNGNLYALDAESGRRLWHFHAGECIWGSACAGSPEHGGNGRVFVAAWDGLVYGLEAATGKEVWRYDAQEPISGSPCLAGERLFFGTRRGTLIALDTDGRLQWKQPLSWHVYSTPAWEAGKVFVVTEDMYVHCLDAQTGRSLWKSQKLYGMAFREFYPVVHQGKVLVSVTPAVWTSNFGPAPFLMTWGMPADEFKKLMNRYSVPVRPEAAGADASRRSLLVGRPLPPELDEAQRKLIAFYEENPHYQTFYVLSAADGRQAYHAVHHYCCAGLENVNMPAAVCADGTLVTMCVFGTARSARLDLDRNRWVDFLLEFYSAATDNVEYVSVGGSRIFSKNWIRGGHSHRSGQIMDLATREITELGRTPVPPATRVSCLPLDWRPASAFSERRFVDAHGWWGIGGTSPTPIAGKRFYWIKQTQQLIAYEGRSEP